MIRRIAHKTKPSRCRFIVYLCSELRFKSRTLPAATLLPELLTTGERPSTARSAQRTASRPKKSGNGVWRVHAALPPNVQSAATHPPFRSCGGRKHRHIAGAPKGLVKNNSIAPQGRKPLCQTGIMAQTTFRHALCWSLCRSRHQDRVIRHIDNF